MPISNRDLDVSEQKKTFSFAHGRVAAPIVTSSTLILGTVPFPAALKALSVCGHGLSNAPTAELRVQRFIAGSGNTLISGIASSMIIPEWGTSGPLSASLVAAGSTLLQLLPGDNLILLTGTANTSANTLSGAFVLQALQDIRADLGSSS